MEKEVEILVSEINGSAVDVMLYAMESKEAETQAAVEVKVLKTTLEAQKEMASQFLQSMGIGKHVNTLA